MKVELGLSDYATKADLKGETGVDTYILPSKTDFIDLGTKVDKLDIDRLKNASADLSKLSNAVNIDIVKKALYDELITKDNVINTKIPSNIGLVNKSQ